jgi:1-phosphofructokinase
MPSSFRGVCVVGPSPFVTVTVEAGTRGPEVHIHAGGQGFWIARMLARLGVPVAYCAALGGETGRVLRVQVEAEGITLRRVEAVAPNGAYVHDRRGGDRQPIVETESQVLMRHEADELYGASLTTGLEMGLAVLAGTAHPSGRLAETVPTDFYRRLAGDLRGNGAVVLADLSGRQLAAALGGGLDLLKLNVRELIEGGFAEGDAPEQLLAGVRRLRQAGARHVLLSRAEDPALAFVDDRLLEIRPPRFEALDHRGPGDSMTAAIAAALVRGLGVEEALRLAAAAGALNITRRGLGTGRREDIERLVPWVSVRELPPESPASSPGSSSDSGPASSPASSPAAQERPAPEPRRRA